MLTIAELHALYRTACEDVQARSTEWDNLADDASDEDAQASRDALTEATEVADKAKQRITDAEAAQRARERHVPADLPAGIVPTIEVVSEPDVYTANSRNKFLTDLFRAQVRNDPAATERIARHQIHELSKLPEERAVSTGTLGGIIPPIYLVNMYAKASRAGRVFIDQVNGRDPLPDEGMSLIVPRLTRGTAADVQASEGDVLATQDPQETDLTVPVRTVGGYIPVSRQTLERASYSEGILFEDLLARYWSSLDSQCLIGTGNSGQIKGVFNTAGVIAVSANSDGTAAKLWNTVANAKQQILTKWGGLGLFPDKIFMHPRRWGAVSAYLDSDGRPLFGYNNSPVVTSGVIGGGSNDAYGYVGNFQGLPVYVDANIPINLDTNSDRDAIVVTASEVVHIWERTDDPVTLAFEQQAGTALQVQLIAYGYAAFTAGRYPDATAVIDDFPAPSF